MSEIVQRLRSRRQATAWARGIDADYPVKWGHDALCLEAADELERLTRELEEARKDQARYRWLRSLEHCNEVWCFIGAGEAAGNLDAAIDAAMSQDGRAEG